MNIREYNRIFVQFQNPKIRNETKIKLLDYAENCLLSVIQTSLRHDLSWMKENKVHYINAIDSLQYIRRTARLEPSDRLNAIKAAIENILSQRDIYMWRCLKYAGISGVALGVFGGGTAIAAGCLFMPAVSVPLIAAAGGVAAATAITGATVATVAQKKSS